MKSLSDAYFQAPIGVRNKVVALVCSAGAATLWYGWILSPLYHNMCLYRQQNKLLEKRIKTLRKTTASKVSQDSLRTSALSQQQVSSTLTEGMTSWMNLLHAHTITLISCKQISAERFDQLRVYVFAVELYGCFTDLLRFLSQVTVRFKECTITKQSSGVGLEGLLSIVVSEKES